LSTIKVNNIENRTGSSITIGGSSTTSLNLASTITGGTLTNAPYFRIKQSASTSTDSGTLTKVNLDTADFDSDSGLDATNKRWVVPTGKGGKYFLTYQLRFESADDFDGCRVSIYINGTSVTTMWWRNEYWETHSGTWIADLNAGDYVELYARQTSGSSKDVSQTDGGLMTFLSGYRMIGA